MQEGIDIKLLGREYHVACRAEDREPLLAAVAYLDAQLAELGVKTQASGERLAVMTALNIAHDYLQFQRGNGIDMPAIRRRMEAVNARLEGVLAQQEKLF